MDNFHIDIVSNNRKHFETAMEIAFDHAPGKKASYYRISKEKGLILYWTEFKNKEAQPLPFEMGMKAATDFVWHWLEDAERGNEPDHDGDNGKGFRIYTENWGKVDDDWQAFVAIKPIWAMYGK